MFEEDDSQHCGTLFQSPPQYVGHGYQCQAGRDPFFGARFGLRDESDDKTPDSQSRALRRSAILSPLRLTCSTKEFLGAWRMMPFALLCSRDLKIWHPILCGTRSSLSGCNLVWQTAGTPQSKTKANVQLH